MRSEYALTYNERRYGWHHLGTVAAVTPARLVPLVATAAFLAGFGVAQVTGVRALGGLVLLAGAVWCARAALPVAGRGATAALLALALALFVVSHPLGEAIGSWPAVVVTALLAGAVAAVVVRPARAA
jgi:hypothetical protein